MPTPATLTFDIAPPRRPGISDVGGAQKEDDIFEPPDPVEMPTAADDNQHQRLLVAYGAVVPVAVVTVHVSGVTPSVFKVSSASTLVVPATFTVTINGTGDTSVTAPANTFPPPVADGVASVVGATVGQAAVEQITNGWRVRRTNATGAVSDLPFVLFIY